MTRSHRRAVGRPRGDALPRSLAGAVALALLAASALGCGGSAPDKASDLRGGRIASLVKAMEGPDAQARANAVEDLGEELIADLESIARHRAVVAPLTARLRDQDAEVREHAAWALGLFDRVALEAVEPLASCATGDPDASVRVEALRALADVAPPPQAFAEAMFGAESLKPASPDPDPARTAAASAAGLAAVEKCLEDADGDVRKAAVDAAGCWGRHGSRLAEKIAKFLTDPDPSTRYGAILSCRWIGASADLILVDLVVIATDKLVDRSKGRAEHRRAAVVLIKDLGPAARGAIPALERLRDDREVGEAAEEALAAVRGGR